MRVLVTNFHPGNGGGHSTYIRYIFKSIDDNSTELFLAAPSTSNIYKEISRIKPQKVFPVDFPAKVHELKNTFSNALRLKRIITENRIQVIHVNGNPDHKVVMLCKFIFRMSFRVIRTKHDANPIKSSLIHRKLFSKYTDYLIVVSDFQFNYLLSPNIQKKTTVVKNCIDLSYFSPRPKPKKILENLDIHDKDIILVSNAGTTIRKGWTFLVEALSKLEPLKRSKFKVVLIGEKPNNRIIEKYVTNIGMSCQVIFTGFYDDVRDLISIGDIGFVLSNKVETISYACREMMAMSKPVLVTDCGGLPENLKHNYSGWIVKTDSTEDLKKFLENIEINDIKKFSQRAYQKANKEFGLNKFSTQMHNFYLDIERKL